MNECDKIVKEVRVGGELCMVGDGLRVARCVAEGGYM